MLAFIKILVRNCSFSGKLSDHIEILLSNQIPSDANPINFSSIETFSLICILLTCISARMDVSSRQYREINSSTTCYADVI
jgi:hypothetical protein